MRGFDSHKFITENVNASFYSLLTKIGRPLPAKIRMPNLQLLDDDYRHDLRQGLKLMHENFVFGAKNPSQILDFVEQVAKRLELYGHYYWDDAEEFRLEVTLPLLDYLEYDEKEVNELMERLSSNFKKYISQLKNELTEVKAEVELLAREKARLKPDLELMAEKKRELELQLSREEQELKYVSADVKNADEKLVETRRETTEIKRELSEIQSQLSALKKEQAKLEPEVSLLKKQQFKAEESLEKAEKELSVATERLKEEKKELSSIRTRRKIAGFVDGIASKIFGK
jgi:chromosome segregation ATPase